MAKNGGPKKGGSKATKGEGGYRSSSSGRFIGRTKEGIEITGPKHRSRHFTPRQAREAVDSSRSSRRA